MAMVQDMSSALSQAYSLATARSLTVLGINAHSRTFVSTVGAMLDRTPVALRPLVSSTWSEESACARRKCQACYWTPVYMSHAGPTPLSP